MLGPVSHLNQQIEVLGCPPCGPVQRPVELKQTRRGADQHQPMFFCMRDLLQIPKGHHLLRCQTAGIKGGCFHPVPDPGRMAPSSVELPLPDGGYSRCGPAEPSARHRSEWDEPGAPRWHRLLRLTRRTCFRNLGRHPRCLARRRAEVGRTVERPLQKRAALPAPGSGNPCSGRRPPRRPRGSDRNRLPHFTTFNNIERCGVVEQLRRPERAAAPRKPLRPPLFPSGLCRAN